MRHLWFKSILFSLAALAMCAPLAFAATSTSSTVPDVSGGGTWFSPDSPLYFLSIWNERLNLFFTFNPETQTKELLHISQMHLAQYNAQVKEGKDLEALHTLDKYKEDVSETYQAITKLKDEPDKANAMAGDFQTTLKANLNMIQGSVSRVPQRTQEAISAITGQLQGGLDKMNCAVREVRNTGDVRQVLRIFNCL